MEQRAFEQSPEFLRGRMMENIARAYMIQQGWFCIDLAGLSREGAPCMVGPTKRITLPDIQAHLYGNTRLVEVKRKKSYTFTVTAQRADHGFPYRQYQAYQAAQQQFGCHVLIMIVEEDSQRVLWEHLDHLAPPVGRIDEGDVMEKEGMFFFPRDVMKSTAISTLVDRLDPVVLAQIRREMPDTMSECLRQRSLLNLIDGGEVKF